MLTLALVAVPCTKIEDSGARVRIVVQAFRLHRGAPCRSAQRLQVPAHELRMGMVGAEPGLEDRQGAFVVRPRPRQVPLALQEDASGMEASRDGIRGGGQVCGVFRSGLL